MRRFTRGLPHLAGLVLAALCCTGVAGAAATPTPAKAVSPVDDPTFQNKAPSAVPHPGEKLFAENCAQCHLGQVARAPHKMFLQMMPADMIFAALDAGIMRNQAAGSTRRKNTRWRVSSVVTGRPWPRCTACSGRAAMFDTTQAPAASGWGITADNHRYIDAKTAGLQAAELPQLELKWASRSPMHSAHARSRRSPTARFTSAARMGPSTPSMPQRVVCAGPIVPRPRYARPSWSNRPRQLARATVRRAFISVT